MKKQVLFLSAVFLFFTASSQGRRAKVESSFRLKAGYNIANITTDNNGHIDKANTLNSFHLGIMCDLPFSAGVSFQGGVLYTGKGSKTFYGIPGETGYFKATTKPVYLEMPLNFIGKIPIGVGRLLIGAGPYVAMAIGGTNNSEAVIAPGVVKYTNRDINFDDNKATITTTGGYPQMKRFDYGANALTGFEFKRFTLIINYGYGLANVVPGTDDNAGDKGKHRVVSFSLGLKI